MKKIFTKCILFSLCTTSWAQITIVSTDVTQLNKAYFYDIKTSGFAGIDIAKKGANQTWNFSSLTADSKDTIALIDPATTPYKNDFPQANLASSEINSGDYFYYQLTSSAVKILGFVAQIEGYTTKLSSPTPVSFYQFPMTFGSIPTSTGVYRLKTKNPDLSTQLVFDSLEYNVTITVTDTVDGWGNITTPVGTYPALRTIRTQTTVSEIIGKAVINGQWLPVRTTTDLNKSYDWWAKEKGLPVLSIVMKEDMPNEIDEIRWNSKIITLGLEDASDAYQNSVLLPNPANSSFRITDINPATPVSVLSITGHVLGNIQPTQNGYEILNLPDGIYYIKIGTGSRSAVKKLVVAR